MAESKTIFWSPRGGNNAADAWGSCHVFSSETTDEQTGVKHRDTIIVDLGQEERLYNYMGGQYDMMVPVVTDCVAVPGHDRPAEQDKAKAIFLTHGHSDHIFGIYAYTEMGAELPPVYGTPFTMTMLRKGFIERGVPEEKWPEMREIHAGETVRIGDLSVRSMQASHSIPGALSFKISNGTESVFHSGDTKGDETSFLEGGVDFDDYKKIVEEAPIDFMSFDALAVTKAGHATYESEVADAYKTIFEENEGKPVVAVLPAAHLERLASVIAAAQEKGRNVVLNGGSLMDSNLLGLEMAGVNLQEKFPKTTVVGALNEKAAELDPEKTVVITTGIYAEQSSPFVRFLKGDEKAFDLRSDAVIVAPLTDDKNEQLQVLIDGSERARNCKRVTAKDFPKMYGGGHAQKEDFDRINALLQPKMIAPIHLPTPLADKFNAYAAKQGLSVFDRQVRNGDTVTVTPSGCTLFAGEKQEWIGMKHEKGADGKQKLVETAVFQDEHFARSDKIERVRRNKVAYYENKAQSLPLPLRHRAKSAGRS